LFHDVSRESPGAYELLKGSQKYGASHDGSPDLRW